MNRTAEMIQDHREPLVLALMEVATSLKDAPMRMCSFGAVANELVDATLHSLVASVDERRREGLDQHNVNRMGGSADAPGHEPRSLPARGR